MVRSSKANLDMLDQRIVRELQNDGWTSLRELARRCYSSEATVRRRIVRLRRSDTMRVVAVVDPFKQGYPVVTLIHMKIDQRQMRAVKKALAAMNALRFVGVTVGAYDMVAEAWFRSTEEMLKFTTETLARVPGVLRAEPLQILEMVTYAYDWGKQRTS